MKLVTTSLAALLLFPPSIYSAPEQRTDASPEVLQVAQAESSSTPQQPADLRLPLENAPAAPQLPANAHPAALRIQNDIQRREAAVAALPTELSSWKEAHKLWNANRVMGKTYDAEYAKAGINNQESMKILALQYFHLLNENFRLVVALFRMQIEQFPMDKGDRGGFTMALKLFEVPSPKWQPAVDELMAQWNAKNREYDREKEAKKEEAAKAAVTARQERAAQLPQILARHRSKIASLNLGQSFLKARIMISNLGVYTPYRPFEEWLSLVLESPQVEDVSAIMLDGGRYKGIKLKVQGSPSVGILFSHDVNDLYLTHITDAQRAEKLRPGDVMSFTAQLMIWAGDR